MRTKVWAHRGASAYAPENTLEAFELAIRQKADGIELDIQMTKDGKLAVIHDETIDRTCDGTGYVKDFTMEELKRFHCSKIRPEFGSSAIPELTEVLELVKPFDLTVNIELKTGNFRYRGIEKEVLKQVKNAGLEERVIYSSFHPPSIVKVKKLNPNALTGLLISDGFINVTGYAKLLGADALHPSLNLLRSKKLIKSAKKRKLLLHVWTVDDKNMMKYLAEQEIDAIITNYPDIAKEIIDKKGRSYDTISRI
ncbi:glycerophosphodiester phosphodiesterase [Lacrimispora sp. BS-2]|uniref:Glycerophosphodiester phosphodiesterase n=1 Tax=Lacrimispora sp. BS-2 TaxID=3151850 RepID=A0AAU7PT76_9FIRM